MVNTCHPCHATVNHKNAKQAHTINPIAPARAHRTSIPLSLSSANIAFLFGFVYHRARLRAKSIITHSVINNIDHPIILSQSHSPTTTHAADQTQLSWMIACASRALTNQQFQSRGRPIFSLRRATLDDALFL